MVGQMWRPQQILSLAGLQLSRRVQHFQIEPLLPREASKAALGLPWRLRTLRRWLHALPVPQLQAAEVARETKGAGHLCMAGMRQGG
jgi:hypothetical protein